MKILEFFSWEFFRRVSAKGNFLRTIFLAEKINLRMKFAQTFHLTKFKGKHREDKMFGTKLLGLKKKKKNKNYPGRERHFC